jgi:hypothetical protein
MPALLGVSFGTASASFALRQPTGDDYTFGNLVESIMTSPQFFNKRGKDDAKG